MDSTGEMKSEIKADNSDLLNSGGFPNAFYVGEYGDGEEPWAVLEQDMRGLRHTLMVKPDWSTKITNKTIVGKWRKEAAQQGISEQLFELTIQFLEYSATLCSGDIQPTATDVAFQSDDRIDDALRHKLVKCVERLEDVPAREKDWHPGSNEQVLDLVHPSLFPLVYGNTLRLPAAAKRTDDWRRVIGGGAVAEFSKKGLKELSKMTSKKFQWLPTDIIVSNGGQVSFESYINNLHPDDHDELYKVLEDILSRMMPMFDATLTNTRRNWPRQIRADHEWHPEFQEPSDEEMYDDAWDEWEEHKPTYPPAIPKEFRQPDALAEGKLVNLNGRRLQVIVKLANIILTPTKKSYPGGAWHVEGMCNESIVATGIYYYATQNISESKLDFRQAIQEPEYEQGDDKGVRDIFALENEEALNQSLGSLICQEGRCICFPNSVQHHVAPFELADISQSGYRKILVFFLIDPTKRVASTSDVPPQQKTWWRREIDRQGVFDELPTVVMDIVEDYMSNMTLEDAKKLREELMEERKYFVDFHNEETFEREFSLCEH